MTKKRWFAVAIAVALGTAVATATEVLVLERNGSLLNLRQGHAMGWDISGGVMLLELQTDRVFGDGFE